MEIHPNAFATELARMIIVKIGHKYLIITTKIFFLRKLFSPCLISSSIRSIPTTLETNKLVISAAIGIITEFVRKSKKSRNCIQMIFTNASGPYPRQDKVPSKSIITPTTTVAFCLLHPISSSNVDTALSVSAIELVTAAKSTSKRTGYR